MPTAPSFGVVSYKQDKRQIIKFGGLAIPQFGGTLSYIDLNDQISYFAGDIQIDNTHVQNVAAQKTWLGGGTWIGKDYVGRKIDIPMIFDETGGISFANAKAQLTQADEQYLTFDNVTGIRARVNGFERSHFLTDRDPNYQGGGYLIETTIQFLSKNPYAEDLSSTTVNVGAVSGSVSPGTANNFTAAYSGQVYTPPVYTLTIPNTNTVVINSLTLQNLTSGETLSVTFSPALTANTTHTVVMDASAFTVTQDGAFAAPAGSFPQLYPNIPAPGNNSMRLTLVTASGTTTGVTFSYTYTNRWEI